MAPPWPQLTQDFDLYELISIELSHALYFRKGDKVTTFKPVSGLIQAGNHTRVVLVKGEVGLRGGLGVPGAEKWSSHCPAALPGTPEPDFLTLVIIETMALSGCSPLESVRIISSPKSQKSCL